MTDYPEWIKNLTEEEMDEMLASDPTWCNIVLNETERLIKEYGEEMADAILHEREVKRAEDVAGEQHSFFLIGHEDMDKVKIILKEVYYDK